MAIAYFTNTKVAVKSDRNHEKATIRHNCRCDEIVCFTDEDTIDQKVRRFEVDGERDKDRADYQVTEGKDQDEEGRGCLFILVDVD